MRKFRLAALIGLLASLAFAGIAGASGDDTTERLSQTSEVDPAEYGYWQVFRGRLGLPNDDKAIEEALRSKTGQEGIEIFSVPLTESELAELIDRVEFQDEVAEKRAELEKNANFGGLYIDQPAGGELVIQLTGEAPGRQHQDLRRMFSAPERVRFESVEHSLRDLESAANELMREDSVVTTSIDERLNVVVVEMSSDISDLADASVALERSSGVAVEANRVVEVHNDQNANCTTRSACPPDGAGTAARGGIRLFMDPVGGLPTSCTLGFMARRDVDDQLGILTAGHCSDMSGQNWLGNVISLGGGMPAPGTGFVNVDYHQNGRADSALISLNELDVSHHVYKRSNSIFRPIESVKSSAVYNQGDIFCMGSHITGEEHRCGEVIQNNVPVLDNQGIFQRRMVKAFFYWPGTHSCGAASGTGGASGAPIYVNRKALGLWKGCSPGEETTEGSPSNPTTKVVGVFSKIRYVELDLNVYVLTN